MSRRIRQQHQTRQAEDRVADQQAREEYQLERSFKKSKTVVVNPKTESQAVLMDNILNHEISVGIGPAGVGKTFVTASIAAKMLMNGDISRIVLTRANVTVGKSIGALPGTVEEKMTPLLLPMLDVLKRQLGEALYEYCLRKKKIELQPFEFVRGRSFYDAFVIVDESQNLTKEEVMAMVTRYESGRIVFLGDPHQHDLKCEPGIAWLEKFSNKHDLDMPVARFELEDIVRSEVVKKFLIALYKEQGIKS